MQPYLEQFIEFEGLALAIVRNAETEPIALH